MLASERDHAASFSRQLVLGDNLDLEPDRGARATRASCAGGPRRGEGEAAKVEIGSGTGSRETAAIEC